MTATAEAGLHLSAQHNDRYGRPRLELQLPERAESGSPQAATTPSGFHEHRQATRWPFVPDKSSGPGSWLDNSWTKADVACPARRQEMIARELAEACAADSSHVPGALAHHACHA